MVSKEFIKYLGLCKVAWTVFVIGNMEFVQRVDNATSKQLYHIWNYKSNNSKSPEKEAYYVQKQKAFTAESKINPYAVLNK